MIKVGIVGSGFIGPAHIEAIRRLGFVEVVALCDSSLVVAQEKAQQYNVPFAYGDVAELLQHPGLSVVHNCTPNHLHAAINRQILLAGKHVFSEKPLCMTAAEARELVTLAEQAGVVHAVSFVYRQFAMVQQAASTVPLDPDGGRVRDRARRGPVLRPAGDRRVRGRRRQPRRRLAHARRGPDCGRSSG